MQTTAPAPQDQPLNLLADWISREQLAGELGLACDTLARWEARQLGPPGTRIGRKVLYPRLCRVGGLAEIRPHRGPAGRLLRPGSDLG